MQFRFPRDLEFNSGRRNLGCLESWASPDLLEILLGASGFDRVLTLSHVTSFYMLLAASFVRPAKRHACFLWLRLGIQRRHFGGEQLHKVMV